VPRHDDATCLRILEQLHALAERASGDARIQLTLFDRQGNPVRLNGGGIPVAHSTELEAQLRALVGDDNLTVLLEEAPDRAYAQPVS
jgi:hypothetical protein